MSTALRQRPADRRAASGGGPARRAVIRWAWRLCRREGRQQLLVLALLTVTVSAAVAGVAAATDLPPSSDATFGTAAYLLTLPASDPHLAADIAAARKWFGVIEVIEHQNVKVPGSVNTVDLRAQDPGGVYGHPTLRLDAGHYPVGSDQVAVTAEVAALYRLRIGSIWHEGGHARAVTGLVENPQNLLDQFALVAPGQASPPAGVSILLDATAARAAALSLPSGNVPVLQVRPQVQQTGIPPAGVLLIASVGFLFIGLVAVAGFTVMAGRRLRALGVLGAVGATDRHVRLVMIANGAVVGTAAAVAGAAIGVAGWIAAVPRLETAVEHRIDIFHLPGWAIGAAMLLAILTAVAAAWWPARSAARIPIVAALSGRPSGPRPAHRFAVLGVLLLLAGLGLLALSRPNSSSLSSGAPLTAGTVITAAGVLLLGPLAIRGLAVAGRRSPIAIRLALRDLARYQARAGAALAAIGLALGVAAAVAISAAEAKAAAAAIPLAGGNLPSDQLIVYLAANADPSTGTGGPIPGYTPGQLHAAHARAQALADLLHAQAILALDAAVDPASPSLSAAQGGPGKQSAALVKVAHVVVNGKAGLAFTGPPESNLLYIATPTLLKHYGIRPESIDPGTDILTSLKGLLDYQIADFADQPNCPGGAANCRVHGRKPGPPKLPGILHPTIQRVSLPSYTSDPNTLITAHAMRLLGLRLLPVGWLIQAPVPLTAAQVTAADHLAAASGLTVETRSEPAHASLSSVSSRATAVSMLLALGVLAMTIGLIRSESASDLRVLTAAGASSMTRRTLTGGTAGALALLGALLGSAGAYLGMLAWQRSVRILTHVPYLNLAVIIVGLPLAAAAGGWLLAGREPAVISRRPLE